jgi:hypothetical protein
MEDRYKKLEVPLTRRRIYARGSTSHTCLLQQSELPGLQFFLKEKKKRKD